MIVAIGISHRDVGQAAKWLAFVSALSVREKAARQLVVMGTKRLSVEQWALLRESYKQGRLQIDKMICGDENEDGYPKSASHLFLRTMEACEHKYPGQSVLWVEPDTLPMRPDWHQEIEHEYARCGKPFLGVIVREHGPAHMAGCGVYPSDWRARAPRLANVLLAPDTFWGKNLGQAFDAYASVEIVPQAAEAKTIQQIWKPVLPFNESWMNKSIRPETALFHQCKDDSGFRIIKKGQRL